MVPPEGGAAPAAERPASAAASPGVLEELSGALAGARAVIANLCELAALEAHRASIALMGMLMAALVAGVCLVAAWLGIMLALGMWAVSLGVHPVAAVVAIAFTNGLAAAVLAKFCMGQSRALLFPATRRQVAGKPPAVPVRQ